MLGHLLWAQTPTTKESRVCSSCPPLSRHGWRAGGECAGRVAQAQQLGTATGTRRTLQLASRCSDQSSLRWVAAPGSCTLPRLLPAPANAPTPTCSYALGRSVQRGPARLPAPGALRTTRELRVEQPRASSADRRLPERRTDDKPSEMPCAEGGQCSRRAGARGGGAVRSRPHCSAPTPCIPPYR